MSGTKAKKNYGGASVELQKALISKEKSLPVMSPVGPGGALECPSWSQICCCFFSAEKQSRSQAGPMVEASSINGLAKE